MKLWRFFMRKKTFQMAMVTLLASTGLAFAQSTPAASDCCVPGAACCVAQEECCQEDAKVSENDCCTDGAACCVVGAACCEEAPAPEVTTTAPKQ